MTKDLVAKGASKAIPLLGGAIAGGITFASMRPMGNRLVKALEEASFCYSEEQLKSDIEFVGNIAESEKAAEQEDLPMETDSTGPASEPNEGDVFEAIEKLARLLELGALTETEYEAKKAELLGRI